MIVKFIFNLLLVILLNCTILINGYAQDTPKEEEESNFFFEDDEESKSDETPIAEGNLFYNVNTDDVVLEANDPDPFFASVINLEANSGITETPVVQEEIVKTEIQQDESSSSSEPSKISDKENEIAISSDVENTVSEPTTTSSGPVTTTTTSISEPPISGSAISEDSDKLAELAAFRAKVDSMDAKSKSKALKSNKKKFIKEQKTTYKGYKKLTPDEILNLQEELASKDGAIERLDSEMSSCKRDNLSMKNEVNTLKSQLERALKDIEELKANPPVVIADATGQNPDISNNQIEKNTTATNNETGNKATIKGIVFKVQLGAYQQFNLNQNTIAGQKVEVDNVSGWKKYMAGSFSTYKDANDFKKEINNMGINDAFIVAYKDGARIDMKTAIEATR